MKEQKKHLSVIIRIDQHLGYDHIYAYIDSPFSMIVYICETTYANTIMAKKLYQDIDKRCNFFTYSGYIMVIPVFCI